MKTIAKIALSNNLKNRTRSVLIMIAISLMTMLLTIIGAIGGNAIRSEKEAAAETYGSNHGTYLYINHTQLQEVKKRDELSAIGITSEAGILTDDNTINFYSMDEAAQAMHSLPRPDTGHGLLEDGSFPVNQNDIVASRDFFATKGYDNAKIGDTVQLEYRPNLQEKYVSYNFIISGFLYEPEGYEPGYARDVYCSFAFIDSQISKDDQSYIVDYTLDDSIKATMNNIRSVSEDIAKRCGINPLNLKVNSRYLESILMPSYSTIALYGVLIMVIVLLSVITIYNIYQVGIAQKIQEYGKIRALGASGTQMKQLVFMEGMILAAIPIIIGLMLGFFVAQRGIEWIVNRTNKLWNLDESVSSLFSLPVLAVCAFISLFAVMLALLKPMRIVSKISPIEATRYLDHSARNKRNKRRGRKGVSIFSIASANIIGNKKATIRTILTMGLSCLLFIIITGYIENIDVKYETKKIVPFGQLELMLDTPLQWDEAYPEKNLDYLLKNNPLSETLLDQIRNISGVKEVNTRELASVNFNGNMEVASIVSKQDMEDLLCKSEEIVGITDYDEAVERGDIFYNIYTGSFGGGIQDGEYSLNETISMDIDNGTEILNYEGRVSGGVFNQNIILWDWIIPKDVYRKMQPKGTSYEYIWIDCDEKELVTVEKNVRELVKDHSKVFLTSYHEVLGEYNNIRSLGLMIFYFFMVVVGLIGFMNLSNTTIINVTTKKQEYGVLQAVGMSNRQLNIALQLQGLIFTVGTIIVALGVGIPIGYMVFSYARDRNLFGMYLYRLPIVPILLMISVIATLQILLSFALSHNLKKETLVERIRYQD